MNHTDEKMVVLNEEVIKSELPVIAESDLIMELNNLKERECIVSKLNHELDILRSNLETEKTLLAEQIKLLDEKASNISQREVKLSEREQKLDSFQNTLETTKLIILAKEKELEREFAEKRNIVNAEITVKMTSCEIELIELKNKARSELSQEIETLRESSNQEISIVRQERFSALSKEIEVERKTRLASLAEEIAVERKNIDEQYRIITQQKNELAIEKEESQKQFEKVNAMKDEVRFAKMRIDTREKKMAEREENIYNEVNELAADKVNSIEEILAVKESEIIRLRHDLARLISNADEVESFKVAFGNDPDAIRHKIIQFEDTIKKLKDELALRPSIEITKETEELRNKVSEFTSKNKKLSEDIEELLKERTSNENHELKNRKLKADNEELNSQVEELEAKAKSYRERIARLSTPEGLIKERDERIKDIKTSLIKFDTTDGNYIEIEKQPENEILWLNNIEEKCKNYGITFPKRILYAFHTALKISDWSPMTVLAGVSGTGKSELPRLYSTFGGINFINVAVQPNWDSQESMLGFFNSIDNKFDAQPLLRFLVQCTEELKDYVSIALLDEMNLAHVEHYFADFLSKLEERRGKANKDMPHIDVKLGAGIAPFELKMRRNILWTGTMNQDETTKSLSDKVLDRGVVINFPRPTTLKSRSSMANLDDLKSKNLLKYNTWAGTRESEGWVKRKIKFNGESEKEIQTFREIIEEINGYLGSVGRAVGHRVWQSIEYYIANYPTVIEKLNESNGVLTSDLKKAMHIAFEDQIVQKVMPKLRGIDTRGRSKTECLDRIKKLLEDNGFNLTEDFENACEFGYGQFIWSSANYIEKEGF